MVQQRATYEQLHSDDADTDHNIFVRFTPFLKCLFYTAISVYPPFVFVFKLSQYEGSLFVPCNERPCTYTKLIGEANLSSTVFRGGDFLQQAFPLVMNGEQTAFDTLKWSPACPQKSKRDMQLLCSSPEVMAKIHNTLSESPSRIIYEVFIIGWFLFKVFHDCLLLKGGVSEFTTLRVGLLSLFCQMCSVAAGFMWTMGVAGVFVAPLPEEGNCACYYQLPEVETLLAIANPLLLFGFAVIKLGNVQRATISGDYLYFMTYDIPYYVVERSVRDPAGTLLVATIRGSDRQKDAKWRPPERYQRVPLSQSQLRFLWSLLRMVFDLPLFGTMVLAFAIAVGPVLVRMTNLALKWSTAVFAVPLAFTIVGGACLCIQAHVGSFVIFDKGLPKVKPAVFQWSPLYRIWNLIQAIVESLCAIIATYILVRPLFRHVTGGPDVVLDSHDSLKCAVAGIVWLVFGLVRYMYYEVIMGPFYALSVKARTPFYPDEYIEWAAKYPEYDLDRELELAKSFNEKNEENKYGAKREEREKWTLAWEKRIAWPKRGNCEGHFGQRVRILLQCGEPVTENEFC